MKKRNPPTKKAEKMPQPSRPQREDGADGASIVTLILGMISVATAYPIEIVGLICGVAGVVLGTKRRHANNMAETGWVLSLIGLIGSAIMVCIMIAYGIGFLNYLQARM